MKKDKKKFLILGVLSLFIFSSSFMLVGCNTNTVEEEVINKEIFLDCGSTSLVVGEETTVSVSNKESDKEYYFISSNEDVATVSEDGVVKGINEGSAKISVFQKDDFNVTASVVINVFNSIEETETTHNLSIDTSNAVMEFSLGDPFVTDGLKVLVDGIEVETYSTNPSVGTTLSLLGENTIYVSYPGCESVSYKVNVVPNPLDTRLYDLVTLLNTANTYTYTIDVDANVQLDDGTIVPNISYEYKYGETAYYLTTIANNTPYLAYSYGYTNTTKGVMKYRVVDEIVEPICYASHDSTYYNELSLTDFRNIDPATMPLREIGGYFSITNQEAIGRLTLSTMTNLSGVSSTVRSVRAYVLGEDSFEFVIDCGQYGTITQRFSDINSTEVNYIDEYLAENGEDVPLNSDAVRAQTLFATNNMVCSLGSVNNINVGYTYLTENYLLYDYTDEYIAYYAEQNDGEVITDHGYFEFNNSLYSFNYNSTTEMLSDITQVPDITLSEDLTFQDVTGVYPSTLSIFNEKLDMFEPSNLTIGSSSADSLRVSYDDVPEEVFNFFGYQSSINAIAFETGIVLVDNSLDSLAQVMIYVAVTNLAFQTQYLGTTYTNFNGVSITPIEDAIASMAQE